MEIMVQTLYAKQNTNVHNLNVLLSRENRKWRKALVVQAVHYKICCISALLLWALLRRMIRVPRNQGSNWWRAPPMWISEASRAREIGAANQDEWEFAERWVHPCKAFGKAESISAVHVKTLGDNFKASVRGRRILAAPE